MKTVKLFFVICLTLYVKMVYSQETSLVSHDSSTQLNFKRNTLSVDSPEFKSWLKTHIKTNGALKKQLESFKSNVNRLKSDSVYSGIDFKKIDSAQAYLEDIDNILLSSNGNLPWSINTLKDVDFLSENLSEAIKIILNKKKFIASTTFSKQYEYIMENIEDLHKFMVPVE